MRVTAVSHTDRGTSIMVIISFGRKKSLKKSGKVKISNQASKAISRSDLLQRTFHSSVHSAERRPQSHARMRDGDVRRGSDVCVRVRECVPRQCVRMCARARESNGSVHVRARVCTDSCACLRACVHMHLCVCVCVCVCVIQPDLICFPIR